MVQFFLVILMNDHECYLRLEFIPDDIRAEEVFVVAPKSVLFDLIGEVVDMLHKMVEHHVGVEDDGSDQVHDFVEQSSSAFPRQRADIDHDHEASVVLDDLFKVVFDAVLDESIGVLGYLRWVSLDTVVQSQVEVSEAFSHALTDEGQQVLHVRVAFQRVDHQVLELVHQREVHRVEVVQEARKVSLVKHES